MIEAQVTPLYGLLSQHDVSDNSQARPVSLRQLQSATGEELSTLMPSILDKAFKGEL